MEPLEITHTCIYMCVMHGHLIFGVILCHGLNFWADNQENFQGRRDRNISDSHFPKGAKYVQHVIKFLSWETFNYTYYTIFKYLTLFGLITILKIKYACLLCFVIIVSIFSI